MDFIAAQIKTLSFLAYIIRIYQVSVFMVNCLRGEAVYLYKVVIFGIFNVVEVLNLDCDFLTGKCECSC